MPGFPHLSTGDGFVARLAVFYAALFVALGVQLPFLPVWFASRGLDAQAIGLLLAIAMVVRVFAIPWAARAADRRDALRGGIVVAAAATVLGYGALGLTEGAVAITAVFLMVSLASTPIMPLADAYALRGLGQRGRAYGPVRLWGSAAFIAGSFGAGLALDLIAPGNLIWLIVGAMAVTTLAAVSLAPFAPAAEAGTQAVAAPSLLRDPAFLTVAAAASLIQASHAVYYGFSAIHWRAAGLDGTTIGALWALGVIAEIVLFAMSGRFPAVLTPTMLLLIGAAGGILRWGAMASDPPHILLPVLQCLHALSFGAAHLGALAFIARAAPAGLAATAQGYLSVALGLVMAGAMGISGVLFAAYGGLAYGAMAIMAAAGAAAALHAHSKARLEL
jgi:PPP family 3-phenylpropionic acid transporter